MDMTLRTLVFTAPSGRLFEIREQNGEDEEIITNPVDSKNLMNLTKYISAIVVKTNATKSGRLTIRMLLSYHCWIDTVSYLILESFLWERK